jgi:hypothetical protein
LLTSIKGREILISCERNPNIPNVKGENKENLSLETFFLLDA